MVLVSEYLFLNGFKHFKVFESFLTNFDIQIYMVNAMMGWRAKEKVTVIIIVKMSYLFTFRFPVLVSGYF